MILTSLISRVGPDGVLAVNIPLTAADANKGVRVIIEPVEPKAAMAPEE